jgi:hypothetical protein
MLVERMGKEGMTGDISPVPAYGKGFFRDVPEKRGSGKSVI